MLEIINIFFVNVMMELVDIEDVDVSFKGGFGGVIVMDEDEDDGYLYVECV